MTADEIDKLEAGLSGVRRGERVGTYFGCTVHGGSELMLHVTVVGTERRVLWPAEECEALR